MLVGSQTFVWVTREPFDLGLVPDGLTFRGKDTVQGKLLLSCSLLQWTKRFGWRMMSTAMKRRRGTFEGTLGYLCRRPLLLGTAGADRGFG